MARITSPMAITPNHRGVPEMTAINNDATARQVARKTIREFAAQIDLLTATLGTPHANDMIFHVPGGMSIAFEPGMNGKPYACGALHATRIKANDPRVVRDGRSDLAVPMLRAEVIREEIKLLAKNIAMLVGAFED